MLKSSVNYPLEGNNQCVRAKQVNRSSASDAGQNIDVILGDLLDYKVNRINELKNREETG